MNDDIEELLARLKPKGVESELRPRVLAAVGSELTPRGKMPACNHPTGHRFICAHCGIVEPRASRARRWAWPGALAAMTSVAAILLVMFLANRQAKVADQPIKSPTSGLADVAGPTASSVKPNERSRGQDELVSAPDNTRVPDAGRGIIGGHGLWRRLASSWRPDTRGILSAGDTELRDDLLARINSPTNQNGVSIVDMESADARLQNGASFQHILRESGGALGGPDQSIFKSSDFPRSRL